MPKKLRDEAIYLAPEILACRDEEHNPIIFDERNNIELDPNNIDDKILIYRRQVEDWFLNCAHNLCRKENNNFLVVMIAISYIEGVEQYRNGQESRGNSKKVFSEGMKRIFGLSNITEHQLSSLYKHLRCGLFHNGMSGDAVILNRTIKDAITFSDRGTIDINPRKFLNVVLKDFNQYISDLKNKANLELRENFDRMFLVV